MTSAATRPSSLQSLSISSSLSRHVESDEEHHEGGADGGDDEHGDDNAVDVVDENKVNELEQRLMQSLEKKMVGKMDRLVEKGIKAALRSLPAPGTVSVSASGSGSTAKHAAASAGKSKSVNAGVNFGGSLLSSLAKNSGAAPFANVGEDLSDSDDNADQLSDNVWSSRKVKVSAESTPGSNAVRLIAEMNTSERIAPELLAQAQIYGSLSNWVRSVDWNKTRNRNECASLAQAIDILLAEGVGTQSLGLEVLLRRVSGVQLADHYGDWNVASALQWSGPNNSLLGRNVLTSTLKQAYQMTKLTSRVGTNSNQGANKQFKKKPFDKEGNFNKSGWTPSQNAGQQKFGQQQQKSHQSNTGVTNKSGGTNQQ